MQSNCRSEIGDDYSIIYTNTLAPLCHFYCNCYLPEFKLPLLLLLRSVLNFSLFVFVLKVFRKEQKGKKEAAAETKRKKSDTASEPEPDSKRQKTESDKDEKSKENENKEADKEK